jgi:hypothetical protein
METSNVCEKCFLRKSLMNKIMDLYIKITKFDTAKLEWFYNLDLNIYTIQELYDVIMDLEFELMYLGN